MVQQQVVQKAKRTEHWWAVSMEENLVDCWVATKVVSTDHLSVALVVVRSAVEKDEHLAVSTAARLGLTKVVNLAKVSVVMWDNSQAVKLAAVMVGSLAGEMDWNLVEMTAYFVAEWMG